MIIGINPVRTISYDGVRLNVFHANTREGLTRHEHKYAHLTMVHAGSIKVNKDRRQLILTKDSQPVNLIANEWHEIEALEDGTVFVNVFAEGKY